MRLFTAFVIVVLAGTAYGVAEQNNAPFTIIGSVGGNSLRIAVNGQEAVNAALTDLESAWRNGLSKKLQAEVPATV